VVSKSGRGDRFLDEVMPVVVAACGPKRRAALEQSDGQILCQLSGCRKTIETCRFMA